MAAIEPMSQVEQPALLSWRETEPTSHREHWAEPKEENCPAMQTEVTARPVE
jgi:hypothetical protein